MRRLGHSSTRAALIYQRPDRDSERAIAAGLSDTISAAPADANGHVAGTAAPDVASGTQPDNQREVGCPAPELASTPNGIRTRVATLRDRTGRCWPTW
jgi:hypothetical protein